MSELNISSKPEKNPDFLLLTLNGNLDLFTYGELKAAFDQIDYTKSGQRLGVDLTGVAYVASSGWGVLMSRAKMLKQAGGLLVVFGLNEGNSKVYETLHVESLMPMAKDMAKAKEVIKARK